MKTFRKIGLFITSFLCLIGAIGGCAYCAYYGQWVVAISVLVLACYAAPTVIKAVKELQG